MIGRSPCGGANDNVFVFATIQNVVTQRGNARCKSSHHLVHAIKVHTLLTYSNGRPVDFDRLHAEVHPDGGNISADELAKRQRA